jgi:protein LTV1
MGKKKFIDKKRSVTCSLVYRSKEGEDEGHESDGGEREHDEWGSKTMLGDKPVLSEARRRELLDLGFPDDGYDYLAHLRTIGAAAPVKLQGPEAAIAQAHVSCGENKSSRGNGEEEVEPRGPFVFLPAAKVVRPQEDVALFDAAALTVQELVEREENEVGQVSAAISAFSKRRDPEEVAANRARLQEMEELMAAMNEMEVNDEEPEDAENVKSDAEDGKEGQGKVGNVGEGVTGITSTKCFEESEVTNESDYSTDEYSEDEDDWTGSHDGEDEELEKLGRRPQRSIASTYWRPERSDRKGLLGAIDDQFERLVLEEYEDEDIGDMDENAESIAGHATLKQFASLIEEARQVSLSSTTSQLKEYMEACGFNDDDADMSIRAAKLAIEKFERLEASGNVNQDEPPIFDVNEEKPRVEWDCESILSLRSNLYNHPGTIAEPKQPRIRLRRNGLPMIMDEDIVDDQTDMEKKEKDDLVDEESLNRTEVKHVTNAPRSKGETTDEKRARKAAVKAAKKENRASKKASKLAYRRESVIAAQRSANSSVQASIVLH